MNMYKVTYKNVVLRRMDGYNDVLNTIVDNHSLDIPTLINIMHTSQRFYKIMPLKIINTLAKTEHPNINYLIMILLFFKLDEEFFCQSIQKNLIKLQNNFVSLSRLPKSCKIKKILYDHIQKNLFNIQLPSEVRSQISKYTTREFYKNTSINIYLICRILKIDHWFDSLESYHASNFNNMQLSYLEIDNANYIDGYQCPETYANYISVNAIL